MALNSLFCADVPLSNYSPTSHIFDASRLLAALKGGLKPEQVDVFD